MARRFAAGEDHSPSLAAYLREIAKLPRVTVDVERAPGGRIRIWWVRESMMHLLADQTRALKLHSRLN